MHQGLELKRKVSMPKVTTKASSDVALVKYWGKKDEILRLPENGSISLKLDGLDTVTTVEFQSTLNADQVTIEGEDDLEESSRVIKHLDRVRKLADSKLFAKVVSKNTFPKGTGLSSSGSGFAALTVAATKAIGLDLSEKELSILARQGSGTACRCICGGIVEWKDGDTSETSYSQTIFESDHWDLRDVVVVVDEGKKKISSTEGHANAQTSIGFIERQNRLKAKIESVKNALSQKDFQTMGDLVEREALEFHSILLSSTPPLIAWYPGTVQVMHEVMSMREKEIPAYFTINTGFNVHVLTLPEFQDQVQTAMENLSLVKKTIIAKVGGKPEILEQHLF